MKFTRQSRISTLGRRATALALAALSVTGLAQTPTASPTPPAPQTSPTAHSAATPGTPPLSKRQHQEAEDAYLAGARLIDRKELAAAQTQFDKAAQLDPGNRDYQLAAALARQNHVSELIQQAAKARVLGDNIQSASLLAEARRLDPTNTLVTQHDAPSRAPDIFEAVPNQNHSIAALSSLAGPVVLAPTDITKSFHIRASIQEVLRQVASSYGIRTTFDDSVTNQNVRFDLEDATYQQAVPIALQLGHLFAISLDPHSLLIAKDTAENRQRFERQLQETVSIPGMTNEQMSELSNIVKNVFDLKQVTVQNNQGTLVIRAPESVLQAVNLTLADIVDGGSQVMFDMKLYKIDKSMTRNIGPTLPTQFGIYNVSSAASSLVHANQGLVNQAIAQGLIPPGSSDIVIALALIASGAVQSTLLASTVGFFGGGLTQTGVTSTGTASYQFAFNTSETHAVDDVQLRVGDRETAVFRVGSRYPITTSTYTAPTVGTTSSLSGLSINGVSVSSLLSSSTTTIPQIQYEDLGLTLKATPNVEKSGAIRMHLELKVESLAGGSLNNIPVLTSEQYSADATVGDGETATLVSSLSKSEALAISGMPGLGELPGFQTASSNFNRQTSSGQLILLITPHLIRRRSNLFAGPRIAVDLHPID